MGFKQNVGRWIIGLIHQGCLHKNIAYQITEFEWGNSCSPYCADCLRGWRDFSEMSQDESYEKLVRKKHD